MTNREQARSPQNGEIRDARGVVHQVTVETICSRKALVVTTSSENRDRTRDLQVIGVSAQLFRSTGHDE